MRTSRYKVFTYSHYFQWLIDRLVDIFDISTGHHLEHDLHHNNLTQNPVKTLQTDFKQLVVYVMVPFTQQALPWKHILLQQKHSCGFKQQQQLLISIYFNQLCVDVLLTQSTGEWMFSAVSRAPFRICDRPVLLKAYVFPLKSTKHYKNPAVFR